jgi:hypothetical protein
VGLLAPRGTGRAARVPPRPRRTDHAGPAGAGRLLLLLVALPVVLAACSSGNAREAARGREAHASEEARLTDLQATYSAGFFHPATPGAGTPAPTPTPDPRLPTLERLVLARNLAGNGPTEELAAVPANFGTVYAGALLHGLPAGAVVSALWRGERGNVYLAETTIEGAAADAWVGLPLPLDGSLPPGNYAVILRVAVGAEPPVPLNSLVFEITPAGSSARPVGSGRAPRIVPVDGQPEDDFGEDGSQEDGGGWGTESQDDGAGQDNSGPGGGDWDPTGDQGGGEGNSPPIVPVEDENG